ncbi:MAG: hypothetical protein Q8P95_00325 [bacterium]|nr:hypothetical protein [bacterium]
MPCVIHVITGGKRKTIFCQKTRLERIFVSDEAGEIRMKHRHVISFGRQIAEKRLQIIFIPAKELDQIRLITTQLLAQKVNPSTRKKNRSRTTGNSLLPMHVCFA